MTDWRALSIRAPWHFAILHLGKRIEGELPPHQRPWFVGPVGWLLEDVVPFVAPVPCKGALGFWRVSNHVVERLGLAA